MGAFANSLLISFTLSLSILSLYIYDQYPYLVSNPTLTIISSTINILLVILFTIISLYFVGSPKSPDSELPLTNNIFKAQKFFFLFCIFSASIDTVLTAHLAGLTSLGSFYLQHGEEYFKSSWGVAALGWDGTAHVLLQIYIAWYMLQGKDAPLTKLLWAGSVLNSMAPLLVGAGTGEYSSHLNPATALNYPYVIVPFSIMLSTLTSYPAIKSGKNAGLIKVKAQTRFFEVFLLIGNLALFLLDVVRALGVLGSKIPMVMLYTNFVEPEILRSFARVQVLQNLFLFSYWRMLAMYESIVRILTGESSSLLSSKSHLMAAFVAGAVLQTGCMWFGEMFLHFEAFSVSYKKRLTFGNNVVVILNVLWILTPVVQSMLWTKCYNDSQIKFQDKKTKKN